MHNSQDGTVVSADGPYDYLTVDSCVGCHSNSAGDTIVTVNGTNIPIVYNSGSPTTPLAGGNFYWVTLDDANGHNCTVVPGISPDATLTIAPGAPNSTVGGGICAPCHHVLEQCESCHQPKHHADDSATVVDQVGGYYRYLHSSQHGGVLAGVAGIEDSDWEFTVSASDHNEYYGTSTSNTPGDNPDLSMSDYCAGCHEQFHGNVYTGGVSPWFLHPTGYALSDTAADKEYHLYNTPDGISPGPYDPLAPVARDRDRIATIIDHSEVFVGAGQPDGDQVMCMSCHRAHGSPYADMLRWDYDTCNAGVGNADCGCFVCHTFKD